MNNISLIDNILTLDLQKLNIGECLIANTTNVTNANINKLKKTKQFIDIYFLTSKIDLIYNFSFIRNYIELYYININENDFNSSTEKRCKSFLNLNDNNIEIHCDNTHYALLSKDNDDRQQIFTELFEQLRYNNDVIASQTTYQENKNAHITKLYVLIKVDNNYIGFEMIDNVNDIRKSWFQVYTGFLFDNNVKNYVTFKCTDTTQIEKALKHFKNKGNDKVVNRLINKFKRLNLNIKKIIKNENNTNITYAALENDFYDYKTVVDNILKPILVDDETKYKAYTSSFENYCGDVISMYDDESDIDRITNLERKATAMLQYEINYHKRIIDIYNGNVLDDDYIINYNDLECLKLTRKSARLYSTNDLYFTNIDGVYVESRQSEKNEINDKIKLLNKLTT